MKYIIILLTSLFLVSNASATDHRINETCKFYKDEISITILSIKRMDKNMEKEIDKDPKDFSKQRFDTFLKTKNDYQDDLIKQSKIYHYLDCREELGR